MTYLKFIPNLFLFLFICTTSYAQTSNNLITKTKTIINPTGIYTLNKANENGETYVYFGYVRAKLIANSRVVINFFICKGYPSYNSGGFNDTLDYKNNIAVYTTPKYDSSCKIFVKFSSKGVRIDEQTNDFNNGCEFGHGVVANSFLKLISKRTPTDEELKE